MPRQDNNFDKENIIIEGERICLRPIGIKDVGQEYVDWLNNQEINQFLESRFTKHTIESVRAYVSKFAMDDSIIFLAIIRKEDNKHIGNIKCGPIDWHHKRGDVGFMVGDKSVWGKGYATEAIKLFTDYLFNIMKLHKITAGAYANNIGSIKALKKSGFFEEARLKEHAFSMGAFVDVVLMAKINKED